MVSYEVCGQKPRRRLTRWKRRNVAQERAAEKSLCDHEELGTELRYPRTYWCGHRLRGAQAVDVRCNDAERPHANFSKVQYCGSVWECPVCSALIRNERARDVRLGVENWLGRAGGVYMMTVTLRHHQGDGLAESLSCLTKSWRDITSRRVWKDLRAGSGIVGYVRSLEVTHGANGWHPHFHFLLFVEGEATGGGAQAIERVVLGAWKAAVLRNGGKLPNGYGVDVRPVGRNSGGVAAEYVSKVIDGDNVALEMARSDLKGGGGLPLSLGDECGSVTPFELLDFTDKKSKRLWGEYRDAIKGKRSIFFTRGLRELLGLRAEKTDDEIIEELQSVGELVAQVPAETYETEVRRNAEVAARMLELVEQRRYDEAARLIGCTVSVQERVDVRTGCVVECHVMQKCCTDVLTETQRCIT